MKLKTQPKLPFVPASTLGLYQEGGEMVQGTPAPMMEEQDPLAQAMMMGQQALEAQDGQMALQAWQLVFEAMGSGEAPAEPAMEGAPAGMPM